MPLYQLQCLNGHQEDQFCHHPDDKGCRTALCPICNETMGYVVAYGAGSCYFEEGRGRWIENLGEHPVFVTSPEQHRRLMKQNGVEWATKGRGMPGQWS